MQLRSASQTKADQAAPAQLRLCGDWETQRRPRRSRSAPWRELRARFQARRPSRDVPTPEQLAIFHADVESSAQRRDAAPLMAFRIRRTAITPVMVILERVLTQLAASNEALPNNPGLGERMGGFGRSSADRALRGLEDARRIKIEHHGSLRRVWVAHLDKWTDWGACRPGHAPYSARPRGSPPPVVPVIIRLPVPKPAPIDMMPPEGCQWPMGEGRLLVPCGQPLANRRASYCENHLCLSLASSRSAALRCNA